MSVSNTSVILSVITPAFNESQNLPLLHERLRAVLDPLRVNWEWVIVDDHSRDDTFAVACCIAERHGNVRVVRLARNFGSHTAILCGLRHAAGECVTALAADLQDPPEVVPSLMDAWRRGAQIVWAVRSRTVGSWANRVGFAPFYYWLMRRFVGLREMPATGADFFLIGRKALDTLLLFSEANVNLYALMMWMGFPQESIVYDKQPRHAGTSGWTLGQKIKLVVDSLATFSYAPIRCMSALGVATAFLGFVYAGYVIVNAVVVGRSVEGWSSLMVVILTLSGFQMTMMGVLGEYLWRALDESRRRPRYWVEKTYSGSEPTPRPATPTKSSEAQS